MKYLGLLLILVCAGNAFASELSDIIQCHEDLDGRSDGNSQKLSMDQATPFALSDGDRLYFVTKDSISYVDTTPYRSKDLVVHLREEGKDLYKKVGLDQKGHVSNIPFGSAVDARGAVDARAQLTSQALDLLKKELVLRWQQPEYAGDADHIAGTKKAIEECEKVPSKELHKELAKARKKYYGKGSGKGSSYGTSGVREN